MKILVLGATGNTGLLVVNNLKNLKADFSVMVRDTTKSDVLGLSGDQIIEGNLSDKHSLVKAMNGIDKVCLIMPMHSDVVSWTKNVIEAAKEAQVGFIVKQSGLKASKEAKSQIIRDHAQSDQLIQDSGLAYTLIQPNSFYQNYYGNLETINTYGQFFSPLTDSKQSMVDVNDVAEATALVLQQDGHEGKIYKLTGPEALTSAEHAKYISLASNKDVEHVHVSQKDFEETLLQLGMDNWMSKHLSELMSWFDEGTQYGEVYSDITTILGRPARTFESFSQEIAVSIQG